MRSCHGMYNIQGMVWCTCVIIVLLVEAVPHTKPDTETVVQVFAIACEQQTRGGYRVGVFWLILVND